MFSAYAESLIDDITMLNAALTVVDQNPLGSAGLRKFVPDRQNLYHKRIGLRNPEIQCRCGQMSRKIRKILAFAGSVAATLAKFSMDVCLYMSQNFDFILYQRI
jgi:argininosuccinate lyase